MSGARHSGSGLAFGAEDQGIAGLTDASLAATNRPTWLARRFVICGLAARRTNSAAANPRPCRGTGTAVGKQIARHSDFPRGLLPHPDAKAPQPGGKRLR